MKKLLQTSELILEITEYFEVYPDDYRKERISKQRTLYSLALTCSAISDIALSVLWKYMTSIHRIRRVFLAPHPHPHDPWVRLLCSYPCLSRTFNSIYALQLIPTPDQDTLSRAKWYLSCIRYLTSGPADGGCNLYRDLGLGPIFCPNLRSVTLEGIFSCDAQVFSPLISTTLESLFLDASQCYSKEMPASILTTACSRAVNLLHLDLLGRIEYNDVRKVVSHFSGLRSLSIHRSPIYDADIIRDLKYLTTLKIEMSSFPSMPEIGSALSTLSSLTTLQLSGLWQDIEVVCEATTFNKIHSFFVELEGGSRVIKHNLFKLIISSFPHVRSLSIQSTPGASFDGNINIHDFLTLRDAPIETLKFVGGITSFRAEDIIELIKTWPMLRHLGISDYSHGYLNAINAIPIFEYLLHYQPRLQHLELPLKFRPVKRVSSWDQSLCSLNLRKLQPSGPFSIPDELEDQTLLIGALATAFPRLDIHWLEAYFMHRTQYLDKFL